MSASLADPPEIAFCASNAWIDYEDAKMLVDDHLRAVYDWPHRRVLIVRPWSAEAPRDVSVLLHELVHHVQPINRRWECLQAPEWEA